ncbi:MAG: HNH endonuclease [Defluviitaleaceae bacterium]|nr:HNH endonuclease [Defluviitaleaceae bacterium]
MKYRDFRDFIIIRTCTKQYTNYESYKDALEKDFNMRCAYCNLHITSITTPFEIDHFIPKDTFKGKKDYLITQYDNLVLSCKKCNNAKGNQFQGDIYSTYPTNKQFYSPVDTDYNTIFYRTEYGAIASDDTKGKQMIGDLKLYRTIHNLAWICEETKKLIDKFDQEIANESDPERKQVLKSGKDKLTGHYFERNRLFIANYNNNKFQYDNDNIISMMDKL